MKTLDITILNAFDGTTEDTGLESLRDMIAADGNHRRVSTRRLRTALYRLESRGLIVQDKANYRITASGELLLHGGQIQELKAPFPLRYSRSLLLLAALVVGRHWYVQGFDSAVLRSILTNTAVVLICLRQKRQYLKAIAQAKLFPESV